MGGDTKSGRDGNGGGSERSAGGGEGGPGAPRGRSLADPLFGAGRRARRRGPNSLTRADGAGVAAGRHRARTGTARAGTRVPAAPSRRWSPGRHRIGIHSVATPIDQLRADPPSRPWSVTAGSARAGARRGPPWTVLGADNPSTSSPRIGLARKDGRRLGRLTVRGGAAARSRPTHARPGAPRSHANARGLFAEMRWRGCRRRARSRAVLVELPHGLCPP